MRQVFKIPIRLPNLNEMLNHKRVVYRGAKRDGYSASKAQLTAQLAAMARAQGLRSMPTPVVVTCRWTMGNLQSDPDNQAAAVKYILDGLVEAGVLENDTMRHISEIRHMFAHERKRWAVEVTLTSV